LLPYIAYSAALAAVIVFLVNAWIGRRKAPLRPEDFERNPGDW
jgi:hypothetical protein